MDRLVDPIEEPRMGGHEEQQTTAGREERSHLPQNHLVLPDVLEDVEAHDCLNLLSSELADVFFSTQIEVKHAHPVDALKSSSDDLEEVFVVISGEDSLASRRQHLRRVGARSAAGLPDGTRKEGHY